MNNCPICNQYNTEIIFKKGNLNKDLINVICKNCSLVYISPRPTKEESNEFHKEEFLSEKNLKKFEDVREKLDARGTEIKKTIYFFLKEYIKPGMKVLDVGCGFGSFLDILKKQTDAEVYGVELGNLDIIAAKERFGLDLFHGSLEEFAGKQENHQKFDVIITHHTFEHLPNPIESLGQIKKILKQGGIFYIGVPNLMNIKKRPDILFQTAHPFTYSPYSLRLILEKAGLGILKFNRSAGYPGGMEMVAKFGVDSIKNLELEEGRNYQDAISYVNKKAWQFAALRRIRDKILFFVPKDLRIMFGRGVYKFFKKYS